MRNHRSTVELLPEQFNPGESFTRQTMSVRLSAPKPLTGNCTVQPRSPVYAIRLYMICCHGDLGYL